MKIYYNKNTKKFAGAGSIGSQFRGEKNSITFLKVKENEWLTFRKENHSKQIKIINKKLVGEEIEKTLEQIKFDKINLRKVYLKNQFEEWYCDIENMPANTKNKIIKTKQEIKEIKLITNKEDLLDYNNFEV